MGSWPGQNCLPRRLAYDGDGLRIDAVFKRKRAALKQRDAERLKIVPLLATSDKLPVASRPRFSTFDLNRNRATTAQRQITRQSNRFTPGMFPARSSNCS